ncbi:MAG: PD-(D/E)XK nuclease family protein [Cyanobacteria bacterium J06641_5]
MNRLSQGHLNLLASCPRKFQHVFLDRLQSPPPTAQQERLEWGNRFHRLMQQRELGLPLEGLLAAEPQLSEALTASLSAIQAADPAAIGHGEATAQHWRAAEHTRTLCLEGASAGGDGEVVLLTVIYDLLIVEPQRARILDWKTYAQPQQAVRLASDWQTRLYLYVLAETSDFSPAQLSMTYWFVRPPNRPQSTTIPYDADRHAATHRDLIHLRADLAARTVAYRDRGEPFPQVPLPSQLCQSCQFSNRCQRALATTDWAAAMEAAPEISL